MKQCAQCGATAHDTAIRCPACKTLLVSSAPPGAPGSRPAMAAPGPSPSAPRLSSPSPAGPYQRAAAGSGVALAAEAGAWPGSGTTTSAGPAASAPSSYPAELLPRNGRVSPGAYATTTSDRRRALPFIVAGCAVVVAAASLWFVAGRGHHTSTPKAHAHTPRPTAAPRPTAKQRAQATSVVQNDLKKALTAEKVAYIDQQAYVASPSEMRKVEASIAWGTRVHLAVGDAASPGDRGIVCLSETTRYGDTYSVADVAGGPAIGTYLGKKPCPTRLTAQSVIGLGSKVG